MLVVEPLLKPGREILSPGSPGLCPTLPGASWTMCCGTCGSNVSKTSLTERNSWLSWKLTAKKIFRKQYDRVDHNKQWKILKEIGVPDHLTCLLRNLYASQEETVRIGHGTTDWFQIGKGVCQGCILSPYLFNLYAEYIMRNAGLDEAQAGIKTARRNVNNLRYADDTPPYGRKQRRTEEPLDESERGEWKSWLKTQHSEN